MALPKFENDMSIIRKQPNQVVNQAEKLKELFDKAGEDIKKYLNDILTVSIDEELLKKDDKISKVYALIEQKIAELVDSSPEALNTLNELASALGNDPNFATTVLNKLSEKLEVSVYNENKEAQDNINNSKVDKVNGKGLSSNDYSDAEKEKLNALPKNSELLKILDTKADKSEGKGLSEENYTTEEKEKLLKLPSRSELDESINLKADAASVYNKETTDSKLNSKVDKEEGKVLSSNDYSDAEKEKLNELPYKNELNTSFSNSLKGEKSDVSIKLTDISPISHSLKVSLSSDTVTDFSSVNVTKHGKNLLNPNVYLTPQTKYGVTLSYIPEEDVFCLNGTSTGSPQFLTTYPYDLTLDTTSRYRLSSKIVSGTATFVGNDVRVFYIGAGDEAGQLNNWLPVDIKTDAVDTKYGAAMYSKLTYVWIYLIKSGDTFDNYKFRIQLEKGSTVTEYEKHSEIQTVTAKADGSVEGFISASPTTILESDNSEVVINCEYNKDINKAFAEIQQAINSLGGNI